MLGPFSNGRQRQQKQICSTPPSSKYCQESSSCSTGQSVQGRRNNKRATKAARGKRLIPSTVTPPDGRMAPDEPIEIEVKEEPEHGDLREDDEHQPVQQQNASDDNILRQNACDGNKIQTAPATSV